MAETLLSTAWNKFIIVEVSATGFNIFCINVKSLDRKYFLKYSEVG